MTRRILLVVAFLALISLACGYSFSIGSTAAPEASDSSTTPGAAANPDNFVTNVTLAKGVTTPQIEPIGATTTFSPGDKIYAIVSIKDAPEGTKITTTWYVVDVGSAAKPNSTIASTSLVRNGTRNVDFSITSTNSKHSWPVGKYKVEILINGQMVKTVEYTVK